MDFLNIINTRRSIRQYLTKPIETEKIEELLKAAMYAPSARNQRPWHFIVVTNRNMLDRLSQVHPYAKMLQQAPLAILVCADENLETSKGYWPVDCSAATQNILLAAHAQGLGSVWLGVYPRAERMEAMSQLFSLPPHIHPFSLIAVGYAAETPVQPERFDKERIHQNQW